MSVFSKLSFVVALRLLLGATVLLIANFGCSVTVVRGQGLDEIEVESDFSLEALPVLPQPSSDFQLPAMKTSKTTSASSPSSSKIVSPAKKHGSKDPYFSPKHQTASAENDDNSLVGWDAPINQFVAPPAPNQTLSPAVNQTLTPAIEHVLSPAANQNTVPAADYNFFRPPANSVNEVVQTDIAPSEVSPSEFVPAEIVSTGNQIPLENSYVQTDPTNGQLVTEQTSLVLQPVPQILIPLANQTSSDSGYLSAYQSRPILQPNEEFQANQSSDLPRGFTPWWAQQNQNPLGLKASPIQVSLDSLLHRALTSSPHIQVAATQPHIRQAVLLEESSRFDWLAYLESTYDDQNDPVGNTLTTGNNDSRFQQQEWYAEGGVRRQTRTGAEFELSQRIATLTNNSRFLVPQDQGLSRLVLNYRQPLLRGRGRAVNESLIVLANINLNAASDDLLKKIQQHLTDLTETYWELVRARSELLQRNGLLIAAERILHQLEGRSEVDALERQVFRARSAVAKRKAEIARSVTSVKNAESRIRLLVNDQEIINAASMELVPLDMPNLDHLGISLGDAISTALANRPDISRSIRDIKATSVQLGIARNDLLPKLDLVVGSYLAGLDDNFNLLGASTNQFTDGRPGFNFGFEFETPIGNRAAQARQSRRAWEANRAMHQFRAVVESGLTEVELAVREVQTAHQEMIGRYHAMVAAEKESSFLTDRWQTLPDENDSVILLLENLLDSQERLVNEESAFAKAQFDYSVAVVKLKQATGTLFQVN
ncbi:TolC family protein [Mariniblastus sp.]|nr:TolC family protein [Mariniblastus sp.]